MATTTSTSTTSKILTRFYNTLVEQQPDATYLATEVARIDSNATTLAETLLRIYQSPSVAAGRAEELAEAFFVLFNRAPDPTSFLACMSLLRQGKSLGDIIDLGLGAHGQRLSNAGYASNSDFVVKAYEILTGGQILDRRVAEGLAAKIEAGQTTRGELIANALESGLSLFHASRLPDVKTALLYIAAANLEASAIDLKNAMGITAVDIQAALASGGLALAATTPYFIKSSSSATDVKVSGLVDKDLMINLQSNTATLGGASGFKAMLSIDGGFDAGTVTFSTSLINGVNRLDASFATGKGLLSFTGKTGGGQLHGDRAECWFRALTRGRWKRYLNWWHWQRQIGGHCWQRYADRW